MGMDLFALNPTDPTNTSYHANWTGWGVLRDLLVELGCDTTQMAGSNDGDIVDAATSLAWANAITANIDRIVIEKYESREYAGGYEERFRVENTDTPVLLSGHQQVRALIAETSPTLAQALPTGSPSDEPPQVIRLEDDPDALAWIESFASFCRTSGGFEQY